MDLIWLGFDPQLLYQVLSMPFALLFYGVARQGSLTLMNRYVYLALGGCILAVLSMGAYSLLLFIPAGAFVLLVYSTRPVHIHPWTLGLQMGWLTLWHIIIQYKLYWLQEPIDPRLLLAVSSLMLLTQRATSLSMDLQEGKITLPSQTRCHAQGRVSLLLPCLSYTLYFPGLLGGPLCPFDQFVSFIEQIDISPPPSPLAIVSFKMFRVLFLEWAKYLFTGFLKSSSGLNSFSGPHGVLWIWSLSLVLRMNYYSHWAASECLNNAVGLGFHGYSLAGSPLWDRLSDGDPWTVETSGRLSEFARRWNGTTAAWLRRLVFRRCQTAPLLLTFGFSAWWHGLHPGQVIGFLGWAVTVQADYRIHGYLHPKLTSPGKRWAYTCLSWVQTQMIMACVVISVELQSISSLRLFSTTYIGVFPLIYVILLIIL